MIARLQLWALIIAVGIAAALGLQWRGGQIEIERAKTRALEGYKDTRRRMDDANPDDPDADADREWLRKRSERDRDL